MTARVVSLTDYHDPSPGRTLRPAEGWTALFAVTALPVAVAWSLDDAHWLPGAAGSTYYLQYLAIAASLVAIGLAKLGLGRFRAYLVGSVLGGLVIPFVAGSELLSPQGALGLRPEDVLARYQAILEACQRAWVDLVVNGQPFTSEFGQYHLVFGAMIWGAALLAATAAIGRHRPLDGIVVTGLLLLVNQTLTEHPQLPILVFFSVAALLLLIRSHVLEEQITWVRRRIGDPSSVAGLYVQSGATFVGAAVVGALLLTSVASSAPLAGAMADVPRTFAEVGHWLERLAPPGGDPRPAGVLGFLPNATTSGLWAPDPNSVAFTARMPSDAPTFRWRAGTYSNYTLYGWDWGATSELPAEAGDPLLAGTGDDPARFVARTNVPIRIEPQAFVDPTALSPDSINTVDRPATLLGLGARTRFTSVRLSGGSGPYVVDALVPKVGDTATGITEARLRDAGRIYPSDITEIYLQLPPNAVGPQAQAILDTVEGRLGGRIEAMAKPYDLARALEGYLRDATIFHYQTDVRQEVGEECDGISTVECFARIKAGYCEYFATTMAVLLRQDQVPARIAYGFLPTTRTTDGVEIVPASAAHWWVEVYFPNTGWVEFDPTVQAGQVVRIPSGAPVTPPPSGGTLATGGADVLGRPTGRGPSSGGTTTPPSSAAPFAVTALLLGAALLIAVLAARRRSVAAKPMSPDTAWGGLGRLAGRFGFGPRPAQTVYEYAGALSDILPAARVAVGTVARAKVEVAYGRRELGDDRMRSVGEAYRRLRVAVLRAGIARRFLRRRR